MNNDFANLWQSLALLLRSHSWHGIAIGEEALEVIRRARQDYAEKFAHLESMMKDVLDD